MFRKYKKYSKANLSEKIDVSAAYLVNRYTPSSEIMKFINEFEMHAMIRFILHNHLEEKLQRILIQYPLKKNVEVYHPLNKIVKNEDSKNCKFFLDADKENNLFRNQNIAMCGRFIYQLLVDGRLYHCYNLPLLTLKQQN